MSTPQMPELPPNLPIHKFMNAYTADQMREYGEACAAYGRKQAIADIANKISTICSKAQGDLVRWMT